MDEREGNNSLDDIGGEPLDGSGFEFETPATEEELAGEGEEQEDEK